MKKELIICVIIIILIIIGNIVTQNYTKQCVSQMNQELEVLREVALKAEEGKKNKEAIEVVNNIETKWDEYQEKLAYYIEHDELEKVESQIFTVKGLSEVERYEEIISELEKCVFILEHIQDKTKINVKNIF